MVQFPLHHHRDDLHIAVGMHAKAPAGGNRVVVDHPQRPKAHPGRVVVAGEGKAVPTIQPIELAVKALSGGAQHQCISAQGFGQRAMAGGNRDGSGCHGE